MGRGAERGGEDGSIVQWHGWGEKMMVGIVVEVDSGYNTTINRFDGGVPRCKVLVELNASMEVDESFTY